jgi:hypothetical protein
MVKIPPRISRIIEKIELGEAVDFKQEAALQALDVAKAGEDFAAEMISQIETLDEDHRYANVKAVTFAPDGSIKVEFKE